LIDIKAIGKPIVHPGYKSETIPEGKGADPYKTLEGRKYFTTKEIIDIKKNLKI
jgi:hypothetical protein